MNLRVTECVYCGGALDGPNERGGRPSRFCSEGCKLAGEAEVRRTNYLLRKFEEGACVERLRPGGKVSPARQKVIDDLLDRIDHLAGIPATG